MPYAGGYGGGRGKGKSARASKGKKGLMLNEPGRQMPSVNPLTKGKAKARTKASSRMFDRKTADKGQRTKGAMGLKGLKF